MTDSEQRESGQAFTRLANENTNLWFILLLLLVGGMCVAVAWFRSKDFNDVLLGVGTGIFASAAVVWGYSLYAERRSNVWVAAACTHAALEQTKAYLAQHFFRSIPIETYDRTAAPSEKFRRDFAKHLSSSSEYIHRGADAGFAVFRLTELIRHRCILEKKLIQLQLLDPRADELLGQRVRIEFESGNRAYTPVDVSKRTEDLKLAVYASLYAAFRISHVRPITIVLHRDNPFYRAEILGGVAFLSFYLGGEYPGTFLFGSESHIYQAFRKSIDITSSAPAMRIDLSKLTSQKDFEDLVRSLGYTGNLAELERVSRVRSQSLRSSLMFPTTEPF